MQKVDLPDWVYEGGLNGYDLYVKVSESEVIELRQEEGLRCPFPVPYMVYVYGGEYYIQRKEDNLIDRKIWEHYKNNTLIVVLF